MHNYRINVEPISPHIGAMISDVDLRDSLDDQTIAEIRHALNEHLVLFFKHQDISPEQHLGFASRFGEIESPHPVFGQHNKDARLTIIESHGRAGDDEHEWHTDVTYQKAPTMGSILQGKIIPKGGGGDTLFISMHAAYESLSPSMQDYLRTLTATHSFEQGWGKTVRQTEGGDERMRVLNEAFPLMNHPVVRTHPETGRKSLFVNKYYTTHINELTEKESRCLLDMLFNHVMLPEFQVRHRWDPNDIAFWDNRSTMHYACHSYGADHRLMHRVTIVGDEPK